MIARLILALLLVAGSIVPAAACAAPAPRVEASGHGSHHADSGTHHEHEAPPAPAADHEMCIGCIAPSTIMPPRLDAPRTIEPATPVARLPRQSQRPDMPPATPPPRGEG